MYRLSKMSIDDKMASASILICVATDLERTSLAKIIKMSEDLHVEDRDVKVIKIDCRWTLYTSLSWLNLLIEE